MARILVIDDDPQVRAMLRQMLERAGYEVVDARDGKEAIKRYHEERVDLVITDLIMPEMEGIETIMELQRDNPDAKIIAISGGGRIGPESYLHIAEQLGALRTFAKPIEREEFLETVEEVLKLS